MNANVLDYLLDYPGLIPENWKGQYIYFWGTIYSRLENRLGVRCLYWCGDEWISNPTVLDVDWDKYKPAAVFANK